jgi:flagellar hook-length control protein FliK
MIMLNTVTVAVPAQTAQASQPAGNAADNAAAPTAAQAFMQWMGRQAADAAPAADGTAAAVPVQAGDAAAAPAAGAAKAAAPADDGDDDGSAAVQPDGALLAAMAVPLMPLSPAQVAQALQAAQGNGPQSRAARSDDGASAPAAAVGVDDARRAALAQSTIPAAAPLPQVQQPAAHAQAAQPAQQPVPQPARQAAQQAPQQLAQQLAQQAVQPLAQQPVLQPVQQPAPHDADATAVRVAVQAAGADRAGKDGNADAGNTSGGNTSAGGNAPGAAAQFGSIMAAQPAAVQPAADTVKLAGPPTAWRQSLQEALGERLQLQVGNNVEQAVIRLEPPQLGQIDIAIRHSAGSLEVNISATNSEVLRQLQTVSDNLRNDLSQRQFSDVAVTVAPAPKNSGTPFGDPQQQGRGRQQGRDQDEYEPGRALAEAGNPASAFSLGRDRA